MPTGIPWREDLLASRRLPEGEVHQEEVDIRDYQRNDHDREAYFEELHERNGPSLRLRLFLYTYACDKVAEHRRFWVQSANQESATMRKGKSERQEPTSARESTTARVSTHSERTRSWGGIGDLGGHDDVGRSANQGSVAAEAGAEGQGPGEGADRDSFDLVDHLHHHWHHCRCEGDVVHECLEDVNNIVTVHLQTGKQAFEYCGRSNADGGKGWRGGMLHRKQARRPHDEPDREVLATRFAHALHHAL